MKDDVLKHARVGMVGRTFLTAAFLLFISMSLYSQVTVNVRNVTVKNALKEIEKNSKYKFFYNEGLKVLEDVVSLDVKNENIDAVMDKLLHKGTATYQKQDNNIIMLVPVKNAGRQNQREYQVSGIVKEANGDPIIGANVLVKGTTNGVITDLDGKFNLNVKSGDVLSISYVGYLSQEVPVAGQRNLTVKLIEDTKTLDEVVVVGYGTQKKINLTGSVESIKGDKLVDRPIKGVTDALQGAVAGLVVQSASGQPGAFSSFKIRGNSSINSGGALVLIDGIPGDINTIAPNDIENISVLKDAASSAIYGARAAEGVILVTTKAASEKLNVSYSANLTYQTPTRIPKSLSGIEFAKLKNLAYTNAGANPEFNAQALAALEDPSISAIASGTQWLYTDNHDWISDIFDNAFQQNHSLSITNSSKKIDYAFSLNYLDQNGFYSNYGPDNYDQFSARLNTKINLIDNLLSLEARVNYIQSKKLYHPSFGASGGPTSMEQGGWTIPYITFIQCGPNMPVKDPNGNWSRYRMQTNPIEALEEGGKGDKKINSTIGNLALNFTPIKDLTIKALVGFKKDNNNQMEWRRAYGKYYVDGSSVMYAGQAGPNNLSEARTLTSYYTGQAFATYNFTLDKHSASAMVGVSAEKESYNYLFAKRLNITGNELAAFNLGSTSGMFTDYNAYEWALLSGFTRINYAYADKYLLEFNYRSDGSSRFSKSNRWGHFPSVSVGWRLSEEPFIKKLNLFSNLKIRASYGEMGNQNGLGYYDHIPKYTISSAVYPFLSGDQQWVTQSSLASETRTWETVKMFNVAVDMSFLQNRLTASAEWFRKVNDDMLVNIEFPAVIGINVPTGNYGKLVTKGWEVSLGWQDKIGDFKYSANFNLTDQKDNLENYGVAFNGFTSGVNVTTQGYPLGAIFGYQSEGLFQSNDEVKSSAVVPAFKGITAAGDVKYKDLNSDGVIDSQDITYLGNTAPRYAFGFNFNATYKNWDLGVVLQGVGKRDFYLNGQIMNNFRDSWANFGYTLHLDYWSEDNRNASMPRPYMASQSNHNTEYSSFWVQNAAYCRLKNLQVGYTFKNIAITKNAHIQSVRLYFSGDNLCEYSKLKKDFDPELTTADGFMYPITRNYSVGLNVNF